MYSLKVLKDSKALMYVAESGISLAMSRQISLEGLSVSFGLFLDIILLPLHRVEDLR